MKKILILISITLYITLLYNMKVYVDDIKEVMQPFTLATNQHFPLSFYDMENTVEVRSPLFSYVDPDIRTPDIELEVPALEDIPKTSFTNQEVQCLAKNIYFEARNQEIIGQYAVAWVVMNRVKDPKHRNTVCGVIYAYKQFSWTLLLSEEQQIPRNKKLYDIAERIAMDVLNQARNGGTDITHGALYYHTDYVNPNWDFHKLTKIAQVGAHIFYQPKINL